MLKNKKSILFLGIFLIITFITTLTFAEDANAVPSNTTVENNTSAEDVYEGDLYLAGDNIVMDKVVNGNVYIMGNDITITGEIHGNLFTMANKVTFEEGYVESSAYICANEVYFKAVATDLYTCANTIEIPENYGVYRDLKCYANSLTMLGLVGRNADCNIANITLNKDDIKGNIYGDLNYSSTSQANIPEEVVLGNVNYTQIVKTSNQKSFNISDFIVKVCKAIVFTLVIYGLAILFTKDSIKKCKKITENKFLFAFGIGALALIAVPIVSIILMFTVIGLPLAIVLLAVYALLLAIASSVFSISIANIISEKAKIENNWLKALIVAGVSLLVCIIGIIPYVSILKFLIVILGFGIIIVNIFFKNINFKEKEELQANKETIKEENKSEEN